MNPIDAIRLMVKHYPGGTDSLAVLVGKSAETLRKEIAGAHGYKLGVVDACAISEACINVNSPHCRAYANAVAASCGGFVELVVRDADAGGTMDQRLANFLRETSDVVSAVIAAKADGTYSDNDMKTIRREVLEALDALQQVDEAATSENKATSLRRVP